MHDGDDEADLAVSQPDIARLATAAGRLGADGIVRVLLS
jgi:hypothetical protein